MLRTMLAALAVGTMVAGLPRAAEAVVTYTLADQVYTFAQPVVGFDRRVPFDVSFNISDDTVASGTFSVRTTASGQSASNTPPTFAGDVAGFLGATIGVDTIGLVPNANVLINAFTLELTFAPDSTIAGGSLFYQGNFSSATLSFAPGTFIGSFEGEYDGPGCSAISGVPACLISGTVLTSVPEPMSLALLGMGLLGMAAVRRSM